MAKSNDPEAIARRKALGRAIRAARGSRTQTDVAAALGVPQPSVCRWEQGRYDLTHEQVRRLELELGVPLGSLASASDFEMPMRVLSVTSIEEAIEVLRTSAKLRLRVRLDATPDAGDKSRSESALTWTVSVWDA